MNAIDPIEAAMLDEESNSRPSRRPCTCYRGYNPECPTDHVAEQEADRLALDAEVSRRLADPKWLTDADVADFLGDPNSWRSFIERDWIAFGESLERALDKSAREDIARERRSS